MPATDHLPIGKILLPVDGSPHALEAAAYAARLAITTGAEILLVHCHKPFPKLLGEPYMQQAINRILEFSRDVLIPYRRLLDEQSVPYTELVLEGPAAAAVCRVAKIEKCHLIVMGSRGCTELHGLVLGSVTHRVLHATPCPVLVVR